MEITDLLKFDPVEIVVFLAVAIFVYYLVKKHEIWINDHEKESREDSESLINVENRLDTLDTINSKEHQDIRNSIMPREVIETKFEGVAEKIETSKEIIIAEIKRQNGK